MNDPTLTLDIGFTIWRIYLVCMCALGLVLIAWSLRVNRATLTPRERATKRALGALLTAGIVGVSGRIVLFFLDEAWVSNSLIIAGLFGVTVGSLMAVYALTMSRYR